MTLRISNANFLGSIAKTAENACLCVKIVQFTANGTHRNSHAQSILVFYWFCVACCASLCCGYIQGTVEHVCCIFNAHSSWVYWKIWSASRANKNLKVKVKVYAICKCAIRYLFARISNIPRIASFADYSNWIVNFTVGLICLKPLNTNSFGIGAVRTYTKSTEMTACVHCYAIVG